MYFLRLSGVNTEKREINRRTENKATDDETQTEDQITSEYLQSGIPHAKYASFSNMRGEEENRKSNR